jgi:protein SCO1/2
VQIVPESEFACLVDSLAAKPDVAGLLELLDEANPWYRQRGSAAIVRMRGWVLVAFSRTKLPEEALPFVLEELESGMDPYLIAAAARALRQSISPVPEFAPCLLTALKTAAGRDEPVSFALYGEYAVAAGGSSPLAELAQTLAWMGPVAQAIHPDIATLLARGVFSKAIRARLENVLSTNHTECCALPASVRKGLAWFSAGKDVDVVLEDHSGTSLRFREFFIGKPSIVVFFYTRCDNPLKCSLTITKLARVQKRLEERGLAASIRIAAITYDPSFDLPARLRDFGERRGLHLGLDHRLLRAPEGMERLQRHFRLGVNFQGSIVNRHRIEAFVLGADGRVVHRFERLQWEESALVAKAAECLRPKATWSFSFWGSVASLGVAFFPKCPLCWAAYLSMFGIVGLQSIQYAPWIELALVALLLINLASAWLSARSTGRLAGACLATAGAIAIGFSKPGWIHPAWGVALTTASSFVTALPTRLANASTQS